MSTATITLPVANDFRPRVCLVISNIPSPSETFIRDHIERLPGRVSVAHGCVPILDGYPIRSYTSVARAARKALRWVRGQSWHGELSQAYEQAFRRCRAEAVLAEYGHNGVHCVSGCKRLQIPLIAHFHGYDASMHDYLRSMGSFFPELFREAAAIVAVSRAMRSKLIDLGAPPEKVHWNPCGVDCKLFYGADPAAASPTFLSVGRFTEKKAPQLTIRAFADVLRSCPNARLRMIGFGPLLDDCKSLVADLGIAEAVTFLGACSPEIVQREMRAARSFVQHSVEAPNGDCEGTPVAVLEAGATGLPIISTLHGGIPDVVIDGETGFLVAEHDVETMAQRMLQIALDPDLAVQLGNAAQLRIRTDFSMERSIGRLHEIICDCIRPGQLVQSLGSRE